MFAAGKQQIENAGKYQYQHQWLHAPDNGFGWNFRQNHAYCKKCKHDTVRQPAACGKQGNNIEYQRDQFGTGIQPVSNGAAREELAKGNTTKTVYLPYEATNLMGSIGGIKDLFKAE